LSAGTGGKTVVNLPLPARKQPAWYNGC